MTKPLFALLLFLVSVSAQAQIDHPKIDSLLQAYVAIHQFNGCALVIRGEKKVYEKSYGHSHAATHRFLTAQSIFPIGF